MEDSYNIVELMDTNLCLECRFNSGIKLLQISETEDEEVILCTRKDCDNWILNSVKTK